MLKDDIENIVASACDGTWNGLEGAYFPEYNNPPQKLADKLVAYIERLLTQRAADECPTCAGLGFVNDKRGRRGVDCSDCNGSGVRR